MSKPILLSLMLLALAGCANSGSGGNTAVYGQISGGVETVHTR